MSPIPFALQPVLSFKEDMVDLLERQLAQLFAERGRLLAVLAALRAQRSEAHLQLQREQLGILRLERIRQYLAYLERLSEQIDDEQGHLDELETRIEAKRAELLAMMQDKDMLERLKEKAKNRFLAELEKQEDDLSDELSLAQYVRTSMRQPARPAPSGHELAIVPLQVRPLPAEPVSPPKESA